MLLKYRHYIESSNYKNSPYKAATIKISPYKAPTIKISPYKAPTIKISPYKPPIGFSASAGVNSITSPS